MRQIVCFSTAAGRQDPVTIAAIWAVSLEHNRREKIGGVLVAGGHRYLQILEGPASTINALMERIRRDQRHVGVSVLVNRKLAARGFDGWSMASFDEPKPGEYATFKHLVDRMRAAIPGRALRDQIDCFERRFAVAPVAPVASPWTLATSYEPGLTLDRRH